MDPATAVRLFQIDQEIQRLENEKLQRQQTLDAFWEHLPPIDPEALAAHIQLIKDRIRDLEDRRRRNLHERQMIIVGEAFRIRGGRGN